MVYLQSGSSRPSLLYIFPLSSLSQLSSASLSGSSPLAFSPSAGDFSSRPSGAFPSTDDFLSSASGLSPSAGFSKKSPSPKSISSLFFLSSGLSLPGPGEISPVCSGENCLPAPASPLAISSPISLSYFSSFSGSRDTSSLPSAPPFSYVWDVSARSSIPFQSIWPPYM